MCSPTSAPEKSALTFYIDGAAADSANHKEGEDSANQKRDSVWALTASSSVKRKSFRKPSRLDRSVHEKRFTSSVRDCSRRNVGSHKDISTRHSALIVASPIKEPSSDPGKPKNSKVSFVKNYKAKGLVAQINPESIVQKVLSHIKIEKGYSVVYFKLTIQ